jgi:tricorn protease
MTNMSSAGYLRYPHIHGDLLAFAAGDEVWLAPASGGRAWPLTSDGAKVSYPRFSPDGTTIAWTSSRDGGPEVYLAGTDGSSPARLSFWGDGGTEVSGWTPAGEVLAVSAAGQPTYVPSAYAIRPGEAPRRLPFGPVLDLAQEGPATALLTGRFDREPASWKRYRGGMTGRIWVAAAEGQPFTRILADLPGQLASPMLIGQRLAFISDHEGTGNIYSCALDGTDLLRHTDHDGPYARNASTDGERIVYHAAGDIWLLDRLDAAAPRRLEVSLGSPAPGRAPRVVSAADHLGELDCDRTGQASVVEVRGTIHWLTHKDGPARAIHFDLAFRARLPRVLGRDGRVAYVISDDGAAQGGQGGVADDTLWIAGGQEASPRPLAAGQIGSVTAMAASPDGALVAVAAHDGQLRVVDVAAGTVTEVASSPNGPCDGLSWSPDSAWLAWSQPGARPLRRIRLARLPHPADGQHATAVAGIIDVTDGRFADTDPVFTLDGQHLAFLSQRSFDPVYDTQSFDLSFPYGTRPFLVPLAAATPSPFGPLASGRPLDPGSGSGPDGSGETGPADEEGGPGRGDASDEQVRSGGSGSPAARSGKRQDDPAGPAVNVDPDDIAARIVPVPVPEARYAELRAVAGGLAWLHEPLSGVLGEGGASPDAPPRRASLERFDLAKRECSELCAELDGCAVSGDGKWAVIQDRGDVRVIPADHKADDDGSESFTVDLSRARYREDPAQLWRCAYDEAGAIVRRDFWVPDMSGVDWDGVLREYRPLLDRIRTASEFTDLLWEVLGELGTSHAYAYPPGAPLGGDPGGDLGKLGADLSPDGDGGWRVDRVLPGESSDPLARSPLAAPGAGVRAGDVLLAVDGQPVDPVHGPAPLLADAAGKPVELTVRSGATVRRVAVVPLHSERRLRYQDWVAGRRRHARELSHGRLGYLHVPDMMGAGWAHFNRDLRTEMHYEGLIIDVRANGGGEISQLVLEKLALRVIGWDVVRWHQAESYPLDARRGPLVAVADQNSASDGDIITAAIRLLGLGPVVGTRTWGGVIGYDELRELVDGSLITVPQLAFSFDRLGWGVENHGVDPDVEVDITPDDWARGRDPQLETAVGLALEALDKQPATSPPDPGTGPRKGRPPLPPRAARNTPG